ncbi:hypothetical protein AMTR_s00004p00209040 [Amborella trichopoda]|uniref:Uncharacterized protein n=1 Tax=Amborella trichopoda TaxID=13333 RepID=W1NEA9_AMBTC|nr:hypothetical protein AMTR_s00004p00209040 [Amborella trichopoda]
MGTKKWEGTALGRRRSKKRRLTHLGEIGNREPYFFQADRLGPGIEVSRQKLLPQVACFQAGPAARNETRVPVLTWISGDGIRRPSAPRGYKSGAAVLGQSQSKPYLIIVAPQLLCLLVKSESKRHRRNFPWLMRVVEAKPEATSSRGQSLALIDRLAVSLATVKRLPSAKEE